jgi:hypothetical protein
MSRAADRSQLAVVEWTYPGFVDTWVGLPVLHVNAGARRPWD